MSLFCVQLKIYCTKQVNLEKDVLFNTESWSLFCYCLFLQAMGKIKILILVFEKISALHIPTKCINK